MIGTVNLVFIIVVVAAGVIGTVNLVFIIAVVAAGVIGTVNLVFIIVGASVSFGYRPAPHATNLRTPWGRTPERRQGSPG